MQAVTESRKNNKSERTKVKIIDSYLDLMGNKKWDRITVKELCEKCSITRSTFYQYYSDIYDLMEDLETTLLTELSRKLEKVSHNKFSLLPPGMFIEKFDYRPPAVYITWFDFVKDNKKSVLALLDRQHGDSYFVKRLKQVMTGFLTQTMDNDGLPNDELRSHFIKLMVEMHLVSAQNWITEDEEDPLTVRDIVNLLNTMRVGACFLNYKCQTDPDFDQKMGDLSSHR